MLLRSIVLKPQQTQTWLSRLSYYPDLSQKKTALTSIPILRSSVTSTKSDTFSYEIVSFVLHILRSIFQARILVSKQFFFNICVWNRSWMIKSLGKIWKETFTVLRCYYRPRPKDDGRWCFHKSLSVNRRYPPILTGSTPILPYWGTPYPSWQGVPPSFPMGTSSKTGWGTPHRDWMGYPPWEWLALGQVMLRVVCLLQFPAGGLSCYAIISDDLRQFLVKFNLLNPLLKHVTLL